jgi:hypothetical protein
VNAWPATHGFISVSEVYLVVCVLGELCSSLCIELWDFDVVGLLSNRYLQLQLPVASHSKSCITAVEEPRN